MVLKCGVWSQGGGPYGKQVTRGQDLTGKDFSGQTLIKQDFKTVRTEIPVQLCRFNHWFMLTAAAYARLLLLQSILRQANFKGANLLGASFFDADLTSKCVSRFKLSATVGSSFGFDLSDMFAGEFRC